VTLELPPQLLPIIAAHILQEAANEPYGIRGKDEEAERGPPR